MLSIVVFRSITVLKTITKKIGTHIKKALRGDRLIFKHYNILHESCYVPDRLSIIWLTTISTLYWYVSPYSSIVLKQILYNKMRDCFAKSLEVVICYDQQVYYMHLLQSTSLLHACFYIKKKIITEKKSRNKKNCNILR